MTVDTYTNLSIALWIVESARVSWPLWIQLWFPYDIHGIHLPTLSKEYYEYIVNSIHGKAILHHIGVNEMKIVV